MIGEICSCTGPLASSVDGDVATLKAWVSATNAAGGINGHPVNIIYDDDQTNPSISVSDVQQMVSRDHIVALIDNSDLDSAWAGYVSQQNVPVVGGNLGSDVYFQNPDFFPEGQTLDALVTSFAVAAKMAKAKAAAFFYCAESPSCAQSVPYLKTALKQVGTPLVYSSSISYSAPSYTAQCVAAQQAGADALIVADAAQVVQSSVKGCAQQGYLPTDIVDGSAVNPSMSATPGLQNNLLVIQSDIPFSVTSNRQIQAMRTALQKYAPSVLTSPNFGETIVFQWVTGLLIKDAAQTGNVGAGGSATAAQMKAGLYALHNDTLDGTAPPLTFKQGQPNSVDCWFWMRMQHGQFTTPYGLTPTCQSAAG